MISELYFLRSTEHNILTQMLHFSARLHEAGKTLGDVKELDIYSKNYGLNSKDLGLYALIENKIAGALWLRLLTKDDNSAAYVDDKTAILNIGVKPEFRQQGIGAQMLNQLLLEAGSIYEQISISVLDNDKTIKFFEKFGFIKLENSNGKSLVDAAAVITMIKIIPNTAVERPSDGYDPQRWMD